MESEPLSQGMQLGFTIYEVLSPMIVALLAYVAKKISDLIKANVSNLALQGMIVRLNDTVMTYVQEAEQVMVKEIKAAKAMDSDGGMVLTKAEGTMIKNKVIAKVKEAMGPRGLTELAGVLGLTSSAVENTIAAKVEAAVSAAKNP